MNAKHAAEAFDMLDDDKDGKASLKDVRAAVCTIFRCCCLFAFLLFLSEWTPACITVFAAVIKPSMAFMQNIYYSCIYACLA